MKHSNQKCTSALTPSITKKKFLNSLLDSRKTEYITNEEFRTKTNPSCKYTKNSFAKKIVSEKKPIFLLEPNVIVMILGTRPEILLQYFVGLLLT